jgi:hypothetical protein
MTVILWGGNNFFKTASLRSDEYRAIELSLTAPSI